MVRDWKWYWVPSAVVRTRLFISAVLRLVVLYTSNLYVVPALGIGTKDENPISPVATDPSGREGEACVPPRSVKVVVAPVVAASRSHTFWLLPKLLPVR
jgi:hypothetical protein